MKYLIALVLSSFALATYAQSSPKTIATLNNEAGGKTTFYAEQRDCPAESLKVIAVGKTGMFVEGCWVWDNPYFVVRWDSGVGRMYHLENVELTPEFIAHTNKNKSTKIH